MSAVAGLLLLAGCGSAVQAPVAQPMEIQAAARRTVLTSDDLSASSWQVLRLRLLDEVAESDRVGAIRALDHSLGTDGARSTSAEVNALAELAMLEAREAADPARALGLYLCSARTTLAALERFFEREEPGAYPFDPGPELTAELHNASVSRIVALLNRAPLAGAGPWTVQGPTRRYTLRWRLPPGFLWTPADYELIPTDQLAVRGFENHYRVDGLGAPVVAQRRAMPERVAAEGGVFDSFRLHYGLTALLKTAVDDGTEQVEVTLRLVDPQEQATVELAGTPVPVAADLTAALAVAIADSDPEQYGERGMFRPGGYLDLVGLYVIAPYRSDRIPVVFVHGLGASVGTFAEMANDILGDPELGSRYQLWFFNHPSGLSFGTSSVLLRRALDEARSRFDPDHRDPNMDHMVVLAHSMGGLMTRLLITRDRSALWNVFFTEPLESLDLEPEDAAYLDELFFSEPPPSLDEVVFMATPHRGSPMAGGFIGRAGAAISSTPDELRERLRRIVAANPDAVTPAAREWTSDSIEALAPETPLFEALSASPIASGVVLHSIVGHGRGGEPGTGSSDGVVPYWSARLDEAVSELSVPSNHIVHDHPAAIAEVKRILREHLERAAPVRSR